MTEKCIATCNDGSDCEAYPVTGEDKCRMHLGTSSDGSSHDGNDNAEGNDGGGEEDNTNAVTHGAYADENSFYQDVLEEPLRELTDDIFSDYLDRYKDRHSEKPPTGIEMELFRLAVSHVKDVALDQWATEKPDALESGNPLVDRETERDFNPEDGSVVVETYKESVVVQAQKRLATDRRQWLKDLGLLEDPETQKADAMKDGVEFTLSPEDKADLEQRYDAEPQT